LPFDQPADLSSFRWLYARSLYKANRFKEALHQIESELNSSPRPEAPWRERAAFYAMNAENFPRALEHYTTYFASSPAAIKSGVILSHAFSLHKAGRANEALLRYKDALSRAEAEGSSTEQASASLEYHPLKTRFIAYGLMAQLPLPQSQRAAFLAQRMTLYASLRAAPSRFQFTSSDLIAQELKDHQRHAILLNDAKRLAGTLTLAQSAADAIGYLSQPVQQSFKNALYSAALTPPYAISPETLAAADALMSGMKDEVAANHRPSSAFLTMYDEARVLHAALHARARSPKNPMPEFERRVEGLARTPYLEAMKSKL
jgi:tetratricopeptide (TPR) repeat protein